MIEFRCHWLVPSDPMRVEAESPKLAAERFAEEYGCDEIVATVRSPGGELTRWLVQKHTHVVGGHAPWYSYVAEPVPDTEPVLGELVYL